MRPWLFLLFAVLLCGPPAARSAGLGGHEADATALEQLRDLDLRLGLIAGRLTRANVARCPARQPDHGLLLHALDQYPPGERAGARALFGFPATLAVEAVIPDGAGARAGVRAGDGVVAINGTPLADGPAPGPMTSATRDAARALLMQLPPDQPLRLTLRRGDATRVVEIAPVPTCRVAYEIDPAQAFAARADAALIQLGPGWFQHYGDPVAAVIFAHELAHVMLGHRALLGLHPARHAAREAEAAADRLSLSLLCAAGYDPGLAPGFWRAHGGELTRWRWHSGSHASPRERAAAMKAELARQPPGCGPAAP